ncbi:MAG TPA: hypothetical protein VEL31_05100 [Ktedonobacteraceae bacterium]|nr:hypothetical protein [Ktedonobacteraceae bacterium]
MIQPQTRLQAYYEGEKLRPRRRDIFFHAGKTFKLIGGLMTDRRVSLWRKLLFVGSVGGLLLLLFFPDLFSEAVLSTVLPIVGTIAGVPIDAGFDWMVFALVAVNLLKFFPAELVAEYYRNIFG